MPNMRELSTISSTTTASFIYIKGLLRGKKEMLKVKNNLKKVTDRLHFKRRLLQRYNINITNRECVEIIKAIRNGDNKRYFVEKITKTRSLYRLPIRGTMVRVVYSNSQKSLVTALPN